MGELRFRALVAFFTATAAAAAPPPRSGECAALGVTLEGEISNPFPEPSRAFADVMLVPGEEIALRARVQAFSSSIDEDAAAAELRSSGVAFVLPQEQGPSATWSRDEGAHVALVRRPFEERVHAWSDAAVGRLVATSVLPTHEVTFRFEGPKPLAPGDYSIVATMPAASLACAQGRLEGTAGLSAETFLTVLDPNVSANQPYARLRRALTACAHGDPAGVEEAFARLEATCPDSAVVAGGHGALLVALGDRVQAATYFRRALDVLERSHSPCDAKLRGSSDLDETKADWESQANLGPATMRD